MRGMVSRIRNVSDPRTVITLIQAARSVGARTQSTLIRWSEGGEGGLPAPDELFAFSPSGRRVGVRVGAFREWAQTYVKSAYGVDWTGDPVGAAAE